jgi:hypothetical protein
MGKFHLRRESFNLLLAFEEIISIAKFSMEQKRLLFEMSLANNIPGVVLGDSKRFK